MIAGGHPIASREGTASPRTEAPLPLLLSIPHAGRRVPPELAPLVALSDADLFDDGDAFADRIYDVGGQVLHVVKTDVARAFVDMNRAEDDRPPANPDGVVKSATCYGVPIFTGEGAPDQPVAEELLSRYHRPYHRELREAALSPGLVAAIDCHTMAEYPPRVAPDSDGRRPLFCLSDVNGTTSPRQTTEFLGDAIADAFDVPRDCVTWNDPFAGGWIVRSHGDPTGGSAIPWIQLEMNRCLYLAEPWFDRGTLEVDPARIDSLRGSLAVALRTFVDRVADAVA